MSAKSPVTTDHLVGLRIISQFAWLDGLLDEAIRQIIDLREYQVAFLLPNLRHEQK